MSDSLYSTLVSLGPGWASFITFGVIAGSVAFIAGNRQYYRQIHKAHAEQLKLKDETIEQLKKAREDSIQLLAESKAEVIRERDILRNRLQGFQTNLERALVRISELETRPDLSQVLRHGAEFHDKMLEMMNDMRVDFKHNSMLCQKTIKTMDVLVHTLIEKNILPPSVRTDLQ